MGWPIIIAHIVGGVLGSVCRPNQPDGRGEGARHPQPDSHQIWTNVEEGLNGATAGKVWEEGTSQCVGL